MPQTRCGIGHDKSERERERERALLGARPGTLLYIYMTDDGTCISDDVTCISDDAHAYLMMAHACLIAHTHTLDAPVCSKSELLNASLLPKIDMSGPLRSSARRTARS